jgi:Fe-S-cluster containining protein
MSIMGRFACSRCGKCCQNFGPYLRVERELDEGQYYCHCSLTGEYFFARVIGGIKRDFMQKESVSENPYPCPFLCREDRGSYVCAIYPSRPAFCRDYRCSSMDIFEINGERRGRVGGRKSLISSDPELLALWQQEIGPLSELSDSSWRETVKVILERGGYRVVLYE